MTAGGVLPPAGRAARDAISATRDSTSAERIRVSLCTWRGRILIGDGSRIPDDPQWMGA